MRALEHLIVNEDGGIHDVVKTNAFGNRDDNLEVIAKSYEMKVISKMRKSVASWRKASFS